MDYVKDITIEGLIENKTKIKKTAPVMFVFVALLFWVSFLFLEYFGTSTLAATHVLIITICFGLYHRHRISKLHLEMAQRIKQLEERLDAVEKPPVD